MAVSATLNQNGKPVAFYSRSLSKCEQTHSSVKKEATAIVEAVRKWSHLLNGKRFQIVTDQRSISFMYDNKNRGKIKNADGKLNYLNISIKLCTVPEKLMQRQIRYLVLIEPVYHFLLFMTFMLVYVTLELRKLIIVLNRKF